MAILEDRFDSRGNLIGKRFNPTAAMLNFALQRAAPKNLGKDNEALLKELGLSEQIVNHWQSQYGDYFRDWLVEALETFSQPLKDALHAVGFKHAMQGDYNFWKDLAKTYGVIKNETIDLNLIPREVMKLDGLSPEQLAEQQQALLSALSENDAGDGEVASAPLPKERTGDSN